MIPPAEQTLTILATFVGLVKKAREVARHQQFGFLAVNETHLLFPYRQAALWQTHAKGAGRVAAISGLSRPEPEAPYTQWLSQLLAHLAQPGATALRPVTRKTVPEELARQWSEWLPENGLWLPLALPESPPFGGLFLARDTPWTDEQKELLEELAGIYAAVWMGLLTRPGSLARWWKNQSSRHFLPWLFLAGLALLFLPVRQSVLAPAEVIAAGPAFVRSPLDGVIDRFFVDPNQTVTSGQPLLRLDDARLQNQLEIARKEQDVAQAEYQQASQQAVREAKSKTRATILQKQWYQKAANVAYFQSRLE